MQLMTFLHACLPQCAILLQFSYIKLAELANSPQENSSKTSIKKLRNEHYLNIIINPSTESFAEEKNQNPKTSFFISFCTANFCAHD